MSFQYKKNSYVCEGIFNRLKSPGPGCGYNLVSIDRDKGTTPFMIKCDKCGGMMKSTLYRIDQNYVPTHEWFKPSDVSDIPKGWEDHVSMGGLVLREIK